jgi:hypothetical protein
MEYFYDLKVGAKAADLAIEKLLDEEKLIRLHPHWFVESRQDKNGWCQFHLRDYATEREFELGLGMNSDPDAEDPPGTAPVLRMTLHKNPVEEILFHVRDNKVRVRLRSQAGLSPEQEQDMLLWIRAIQEYLRLYATTTPQTLVFRGIMNGMMLKMNPSQRKITIMLTKITVIELLVTIIIVVGYVYFG